ncbi:MAG: LamG-like jellyroll fold domain-containing protein [Byssovorax sp.]
MQQIAPKVTVRDREDLSLSGRRRRGWGLRAALGLGALIALGGAAVAGCGSAESGPGGVENEALGSAAQAASTPITCVDLRRAAPFKASDAQISLEKASTNYGASGFALAGASSTGPAEPFQALFRFDLTPIPKGATITAASLSLSQINTGAATARAHLIKAPWDEATVTWQSFGGAYEAAFFKSFSTAPGLIVLDLLPQVQAWVDGTVPNHGFLIEQPGSFQTRFKTQEYAVPQQRPVLHVCYQVVCAPGFADCNGDAADGCESDLSSPANCGGCGNMCPSPAHGVAACAGGSCAIGACDLGFSDCDGAAANGCETSLTTLTDCGACGVACALPGATSTCAGGTCKVASCNAGTFDCDGNAANGCEALPCADGSHCASGAGCKSGVCLGGVCAGAACNDHAKNGSESDIDCGGACPPCVDGSGCGSAADCANGVCVGGVCQPPTCADHVKNGDETGVDCGGACTVPEVCNGLDDDCDGQVDEDLGTTICGVGACQVMVQSCANGHAQSCVPGSPKAEVCDGIDNDCDGQVDNGLGTITCGAGACATSVAACANGAPGVCDPHATDGLSCNDNHACTGNDACNSGVCAGALLPAGTACRASAGACDPAESCTGAAVDCPADQKLAAGTVCRAAGGTCDVAESCDGSSAACPVDALKPAGTTLGACATGLLGVCSAGTSTCSGGAVSPSCVQNVASSAETCDGLDNNCNGATDENGACNASGLVSWWSAENSTIDSVSGNNGTLTNGATYGVRGAQQCFSLDGINDYVMIGNPASLKISSGITLMAWVNPVAAASGTIYQVITKWGQNAGTDAYTLSLVSAGATFQVSSGVGVPNVADTTGLPGGTISPGSWTHVAMTYDGATGINRVYVNGVQVNQRNRAGGITISNLNVVIGKEDSILPRYYKGLIDEVQVYGRALTVAEIAAIYHAG